MVVVVVFGCCCYCWCCCCCWCVWGTAPSRGPLKGQQRHATFLTSQNNVLPTTTIAAHEYHCYGATTTRVAGTADEAGIAERHGERRDRSRSRDSEAHLRGSHSLLLQQRILLECTNAARHSLAGAAVRALILPHVSSYCMDVVTRARLSGGVGGDLSGWRRSQPPAGPSLLGDAPLFLDELALPLGVALLALLLGLLCRLAELLDLLLRELLACARERGGGWGRRRGRNHPARWHWRQHHHPVR